MSGAMIRRLLRHFEPLGLIVLGLLLRALTLPLPAALRPPPGGTTARSSGVQYTDAAGTLLREVRDESGARSRVADPAVAHSLLAEALVEAEDRRFRVHPGIDPVGVLRAAWHDLRPGRSLQGASTLTMQLARAVVPHRRTLMGKLEEAALALRIEASLDKDEIMLAYLTEAPFGPQLRGAEAAAEQLFGKPSVALSPAEAATLASLPKAPGQYLTERGRTRLQARRDDLLRRLHDRGRLDDVTLARALVEPLPERLAGGGLIAPHLVEAVRAGRLGPVPAGDRVQLALSLPLQARVEAAVKAQVEALRERHVGAGAAVVLDNRSGAILAYVGSADFLAAEGQNDGVLALRQPGSSLKPFVYALALEDQRIDGGSVLPDLPIRLEGEDGVFAPRNYDGVFHGPVRAREALGNSYNVPAVWLADRLGVGAVLSGLRRFGFVSLRETASHYGAALALGDGEVKLLELAEAYA
ncbi:MAG: penicillin-binding protein 1C, partial [Myxococcales bacterium]